MRYGSKRLEIRRPPIAFHGVQIVGGFVFLVMALVTAQFNYGLVNDALEFVQETIEADYTEVERIISGVHMITLAVYAFFFIPTLLAVAVTGLKYLLRGVDDLLTPWMPANIPGPFRDFSELTIAFKDRSLSIYKEMEGYVIGLFGHNTMFLPPSCRAVVLENAKNLQNRIVAFFLAGLALGGVIFFGSWVTSDAAGRVLRDVASGIIGLLTNTRHLNLLRLPFILLVARQIALGAIEYFATKILVPLGQPSTVSHEGSQHFRGFGHPSQLFSRLPDVSQPLQWEGFANRAHSDWKEAPTLAVGDVGEFGGFIIVEQQPQPIKNSHNLAAYLLLGFGWLAYIVGYAMFLFMMLPGQAREFRGPGDEGLIYGPIIVAAMGFTAFGLVRAGGRFVRQARTLLEATQFASLAILIEIVGNLSRADVKVGKSMADSVESSSVVARSDFTARFWSAELISEAVRLDQPRELLALNQTSESQNWIAFFRNAIEDLREEGVRPLGVDLASPPVQEVVRANIDVSALRAGAVERAQLQAAEMGDDAPLLEELEKPPLISGPRQTEEPSFPPVPPEASSDYKECPDCAEFVRVRARKCRFCGFRFDE